MNTHSIIKRLENFKLEIDEDINSKNITNLIAIDIFGFIIDTAALKELFDSRIYYENKLAHDTYVTKIQQTLIEVINQTLALFPIGTIPITEKYFDCSYFRKHQKDSSISTIDAIQILRTRESYWMIGEESTKHVRKQYTVFEDLKDYLINEIKIKPSSIDKYKVLNLSYELTINDYKLAVEVSYDKNHILDFESFLIWVMDKYQYQDYSLWGNFPKGKNIIDVKSDEISKITKSVIDDLIIDLEKKETIELSDLKTRNELDNINFKTVNVFEYAGIILDINKCNVQFDGKVIPINPSNQEIKLLKLLLANKENVTTYPQIEEVLGISNDSYDRSIIKSAKLTLIKVLANGDQNRAKKLKTMIKNNKTQSYYLVGSST